MGVHNTARANDNNSLDVDVLHWWISDGERRALNVIKQDIESKHITWTDHGVSNFSTLRESVSKRLSLNIPPLVSQWLAGPDLATLYDQGYVRTLPKMVNNEAIESLMYDEVLNEVQYKKNIIALPVGIHISNKIVYNNHIYKKLQLTKPSSWDEFIQQAKVISNAGYIPLALSGRSWQLGLLFNSILIDQNGADIIDIIYGSDSTKRIAKHKSDINKAFKKLLTLKQYADAKHLDRSWNESTKLMIDNKAAAQVMGDFNKGELMRFDEKHINEKYTCDLAPGNNKTIIFGIDVFVLFKPGTDDEKKSQDALINTVLSPKVQAEYIKYKGGIPVNKTMKPSNVDLCARSSLNLWQSPDVKKIRHVNSKDRFKMSIIRTHLSNAWKQNKPVNYDYATPLIHDIMNLKDGL